MMVSRSALLRTIGIGAVAGSVTPLGGAGDAAI